MERRYLAATIAMAATFALFSHAFSSGLMSKLQAQHTVLISELHCAAQSLRSQLLDKVNRSLGSSNAEEAQLRVELNLPAPAAPVPPVPPVPAVAPVAPRLVHAAAKVQAPLAFACPAARLATDVRFSQDFNSKLQARMMAVQSRLLADQARLQAKMMAQQARLSSQAMQREISRAAIAQARVNIAQARLDSRIACRTSIDRAVRDSMSNTDWNQLGRDISDQVNRSVQDSLRNF
jgi:hypothetical protein